MFKLLIAIVLVQAVCGYIIREGMLLIEIMTVWLIAFCSFKGFIGYITGVIQV